MQSDFKLLSVGTDHTLATTPIIIRSLAKNFYRTFGNICERWRTFAQTGLEGSRMVRQVIRYKARYKVIGMVVSGLFSILNSLTGITASF